jgi:hypothetical protein
VDHSVEIRYAGVVVGRGALVKDLGPEAAFVCIPEPLPVGTLVTLKIGDVTREARVDDVVESSEPTAVGMRVRWGGAPTTRPAPSTPPPVERPPVAAAPAEPAGRPAEGTADSGPPVAEGGSTAAENGPTLAVAAGDARGDQIAAPLSLAGPGGDGSHHGGGKRRRKRR